VGRIGFVVFLFEEEIPYLFREVGGVSRAFDCEPQRAGSPGYKFVLLAGVVDVLKVGPAANCDIDDDAGIRLGMLKEEAGLEAGGLSATQGGQKVVYACLKVLRKIETDLEEWREWG
jgi:hypothetical protein